jgi:hypothetical protein
MQQLIYSLYFKVSTMKKLLSFFLALLAATTASFSQHTPFVLTPDLEVTDSGTITREQWRDSLFRMDMNLVPTGFLLEYSLFGFESDKYNGTGNDDDTIKNDGRIFELHNILWHSKVNDSAAIGETDSLFSKAFFENRNNHTAHLYLPAIQPHTANRLGRRTVYHSL